MANLLWGNVYYHDHYAGRLQQEPGDRASFTYDADYLRKGLPPVAHTLLTSRETYISELGLHPFFDNLVAEGWLEKAQGRLLGKRQASRFELLLAFGYDCAGAVSVIDPEPSSISEQLLDKDDPKELAIFTSRASLSGVQPKLAVAKRGVKFIPTKVGELSTHIAKFASKGHADLVANEYLTTKAFQAFLPDDTVAEVFLGEVDGISEPALLITRFDREVNDNSITRCHFEEFNQLLGRRSAMKYEADHREMADFIAMTPGCMPVENYRLFARIVVGLLLGNTDMHLKNFALFHEPAGLRLTPTYDMVAAALYDYKSVALKISNTADLPIGSLKPKHIAALAKDFGLPNAALMMLMEQMEKRLDTVRDTIASANTGTAPLKDKLIQLMDKRWNGTCRLIGQHLSKRP